MMDSNSSKVFLERLCTVCEKPYVWIRTSPDGSGLVIHQSWTTPKGVGMARGCHITKERLEYMQRSISQNSEDSNGSD